MDGKEDEIATGKGAAEAQDAQGKPGAQTAGEAAAAPVAKPPAAGGQTPAGAGKSAVDYAAEIASRDAKISERGGKIVFDRLNL